MPSFQRGHRAKAFSLLSIFIFAALGARADVTEGVPLRGFADFSVIHEAADDSDSFQLHEVDFFVAKQIDDTVSFLIELCFQPSFDGVGADLERTYVQYRVNSNWLKISGGRFHTSLGYWNDTFHHGGYLQTAATRPVMERFEDAGGLLPTHTTGVELRGNGPMSNGIFGYIVSVGNGRGPVKDPPAFYYDYNKSKSLAALAYYEFNNGLRTGVNYYHSDLPGGGSRGPDGIPSATIVGPAGGESIYGAHAVYQTAAIEWLTEYQHMEHTYKNNAQLSLMSVGSSTATVVGPAQSTHIDLLYSQLGYHLGQYTPYMRFELNETDNVDAYLNAPTADGEIPGLLGTTRYYVAGMRYELSPASALKFEATYVDSRASILEQLKIAGADPARHSDWSTNLNWSYGW